MSKFRVYRKWKCIATIWASDADEARHKISREYGIPVEELSASDLIEHDRGNEP